MGKAVEVLPALSVEEGIKATRMMFPRTYFDQDKGRAISEHLKRLQAHDSPENRQAGAPLHDEHSHGADMFRYARDGG